jgi:hypothetical protein
MQEFSDYIETYGKQKDNKVGVEEEEKRRVVEE